MKDGLLENKERAQALVELAMSLVLLLILLAGMVDFGRAFITYIALRDAAQEGASYASVVNTKPMEYSDISTYCTNITNRVLSTTDDLQGSISSSLIDLQGLSDIGDITVETDINDVICVEIAEPGDVCMGNNVSVAVTYKNFPLTMPFIGTIIGTQSIPLRAIAIDKILTPSCQ